MADLENKLKETAEQAADVAKNTVAGVKEEAKAFAADTKGYSADVVEAVKSEGKEVQGSHQRRETRILFYRRRRRLQGKRRQAHCPRSRISGSGGPGSIS